MPDQTVTTILPNCWFDSRYRCASGAFAVLADAAFCCGARCVSEGISHPRSRVRCRECGMTTDTNFPSPGHFSDYTRLLKVIRVIDTSQIAANSVGNLTFWERYNVVSPARRQCVWRPAPFGRTTCTARSPFA